MSTTNCQVEACKEPRLPMFHRTIRVPSELWQAVKSRSDSDGKSIRWVVDEALDAELMALIETLRRLGFRGEAKADKLARIPLDDNIIARINYGRRQTGLPAVVLLRICLERHTAAADANASHQPQGT